jgi:hypothetical protein
MKRPTKRPTVAAGGNDPMTRAQFVSAVECGLADVAAGRTISDDELRRELDRELGPMSPRGRG